MFNGTGSDAVDAHGMPDRIIVTEGLILLNSEQVDSKRNNSKGGKSSY
jgi:hypothetical protein